MVFFFSLITVLDTPWSINNPAQADSPPNRKVGTGSRRFSRNLDHGHPWCKECSAGFFFFGRALGDRSSPFSVLVVMQSMLCFSFTTWAPLSKWVRIVALLFVVEWVVYVDSWRHDYTNFSIWMPISSATAWRKGFVFIITTGGCHYWLLLLP